MEDRDNLNEFLNDTRRLDEREIENSYYRNRKPKKKSKKGLIALVLCTTILGSVLGSAITLAVVGEKVNNAATTTTTLNQPINITTTSNTDVGSAVFKKVVPSVVGITTKGYQRTIFGTQAVTGTGSGVIISKDGYILTNSHVIRIGNNISKDVEVYLNDGKNIKGKVVWSDTAVDIAIVKVEGVNNLLAAELGDSDSLEVGQVAIAIGNPIDLAFQRSLSKGVISGLNRFIGQVDGGGYMVGLIQTDASINGGNSGGPLVDEQGKIIGINTVKLQTAEGMGFAIPINSIKPIIESVLKTGEYQPVALGATIMPVQTVQRMVNRSLGTNYGLFIGNIQQNSPAESAGLKKGDILLEIDGNKIVSNETLRALLYKYKPGDKAKLTILRNGKKVEIEITFTEYKVPKQKFANGQDENLPNQNENNDQNGQNRNDLPDEGNYGNGNENYNGRNGYGNGDADDFLDFFSSFFGNN